MLYLFTFLFQSHDRVQFMIDAFSCVCVCVFTAIEIIKHWLSFKKVIILVIQMFTVVIKFQTQFLINIKDDFRG